MNETPETPDTKKPGDMFDTRLIELLRPTVATCFQQHADVLRSVMIVFDYYGGLNDTPGLQKGMWLGPYGAVTTADGIIGSAKNMLETLHVVMDRAGQLLSQLETTLVERQKQLLQQGAADAAPSQEAEPTATLPGPD